MSKAEEEANKRYCVTRGDDTEETTGVDMQRASDFIDGYHQAEKDMELTVDDIKNIDRLLNQCVDCNNPYQEVLKRFNKERKENEIRK